MHAAGGHWPGPSAYFPEGCARPPPAAALLPPGPLSSGFPSSRAHLWDRTPAGPVTAVDLQNLRLHLRVVPGVWPLLQRLQGEQGGSGATMLHARLAPDGGGSTTRGSLHLELVAGSAPPRSAAVPVRFGAPAGCAADEAQRLASALEVAASCAPSPAGLANLLAARLTCRADGGDGLVLEGSSVTAAPFADFKPLLAKRVAPTPLAQRLQGLLRGGGGACSALEDGLLSMDRGRALVPLEASDGAAYSVPLVGCWVAAPDADVRHPLVAAASLRFLCSRALADKATAPGASFLLLLYACGSAAVPACYEVHIGLDPASGGVPLLAHRLSARWRPGQDEAGSGAATTAEPCRAIALPALPAALGSRQPAAAAAAAAACHSGLAARLVAPTSSAVSHAAPPSSSHLLPPPQLFYTPPAPSHSGQPAWASPPSACWPPAARLEPSPAASTGLSSSSPAQMDAAGTAAEASAAEGGAAAAEAEEEEAVAAGDAEAEADAGAALAADAAAAESEVEVEGAAADGSADSSLDSSLLEAAVAAASPAAAAGPQHGSDAAELSSPPSLEAWHTSSASFVFESPRKAVPAPVEASPSAAAASVPTLQQQQPSLPAQPASPAPPAVPDAATALQPLQLLLALQQALGTLPACQPRQQGGDMSGDAAQLLGEVRALRLEVAELRSLVQALQPAPAALPAASQQQAARDDAAPGATEAAAHASPPARPAAAPAAAAADGSPQQQRQPWEDAEAAIDEMLAACEASSGLAGAGPPPLCERAAHASEQQAAAVVEQRPPPEMLLQQEGPQLQEDQPVEHEAEPEQQQMASPQARGAPPAAPAPVAAATVPCHPAGAGAAAAKLAAAAAFGEEGEEDGASSDDEEDWLLMAKYSLPVGRRSSAALHRRPSID